MTKYGAYYRNRKKEIVWFRTRRPLETGFYQRHTHFKGSPDVYIAESVPALIMKVYPWIQEAEKVFQQQASSPGLNDEEKGRISENMTDRLVQHLDPNADNVWIDEPHWVKHLKPD